MGRGLPSAPLSGRLKVFRHNQHPFTVRALKIFAFQFYVDVLLGL